MTHGSPWRYDSYVPLVFAGAGFTAMTVDRWVNTVDPDPWGVDDLLVAPVRPVVGL